MPTPYNKNLKASDYKYYLACGDSLSRLESYNTRVEQVVETATKLVEEHGAQMAQVVVGAAQKHVTGLVFLDEIPLDWKQETFLTAKPKGTLSSYYNVNSQLFDLQWDDPHHCLRAHTVPSERGGYYFTLAAKINDKWLIASPVGTDGTSCVPKDAKQLTMFEYKTLAGARLDDDVISPSEDERYTDHPSLNQYPFDVKDEYKEKYKVANRAIWDGHRSPIPQATLSGWDKVKSNFPVLKKLGL